jgi:hypothetical protein
LTGRYELALGAGNNGTIILDPSDREAAPFTNTIHLRETGQSPLPRYPGWDDTQVPFCVNQFCGNALMDTGAPAPSLNTTSRNDVIDVGAPAGSTSVPAGTSLKFKINTGSTFTITAPTSPMISLNGNMNNIGQIPFHNLDAIYDYGKGTISLASHQ